MLVIGINVKNVMPTYVIIAVMEEYVQSVSIHVNVAHICLNHVVVGIEDVLNAPLNMCVLVGTYLFIVLKNALTLLKLSKDHRLYAPATKRYVVILIIIKTVFNVLYVINGIVQT
jgi:hypothetical protein